MELRNGMNAVSIDAKIAEKDDTIDAKIAEIGDRTDVKMLKRDMRSPLLQPLKVPLSPHNKVRSKKVGADGRPDLGNLPV